MKAVVPTVAAILLLIATGCGTAEQATDKTAVDEPATSTSTAAVDAPTSRSESAEPEPAENSTTADEPTPSPEKQKPRVRRYLVADVADGDTIDLAHGKTVGLVGIVH